MRRKLFNLIFAMVQTFNACRVPRSAAALSYSLTLALFPTLICLYALLGSVLPNSGVIYDAIGAIVPHTTVETLTDYIDYISRHNSAALVTAGVILMATMSAAAFRPLNHTMNDTWKTKRFRGTWAFIISFPFSVVFLAVIYFSVVVILTGNWFLRFLESTFPDLILSHAWEWLRFFLLFFVLLLIVLGIYRLTAPKRNREQLLPGAMAATAALVVTSILFSWFIGMSARNPLVYGSLASVIILMLWIYACGIILITGNILNYALIQETERTQYDTW